ncbi:unnamed protein product [Lampetra planeri]
MPSIGIAPQQQQQLPSETHRHGALGESAHHDRLLLLLNASEGVSEPQLYRRRRPRAEAPPSLARRQRQQQQRTSLHPAEVAVDALGEDHRISRAHDN